MCACVFACALVQLWLAPASLHPLGCPLPAIPRSSLSKPWQQGACALITRDPWIPRCSSAPIPYLSFLLGHQEAWDLPRLAEAGRGGWGNGCGEWLPLYKPHTLLRAEYGTRCQRLENRDSLPTGGLLPEKREEGAGWAKKQVKVGLNLGPKLKGCLFSAGKIHRLFYLPPWPFKWAEALGN